jgi:hypothetical protein
VKVNLDQWLSRKKNYGKVLVSAFLGMRNWREKRLFRIEYMSEFLALLLYVACTGYLFFPADHLFID